MQQQKILMPKQQMTDDAQADDAAETTADTAEADAE